MTEKATFSIGAVARLLDVSVHALRKWEERHGAIHPSRSAGGARRYSRTDVERLSKLKRLTNRGQAISALASLEDDELDALLEEGTAQFFGDNPDEPQPVSLAVVGERLAHDLRKAHGRMPGAEVAAAAASVDALGRPTADVVVTELGSLGEDTSSELTRLRTATGIGKIVVVYGYGSITVAERLSDAATALVRRPINHRELARVVLALAGAQTPGLPALGLPPHRFTRKVLAAMAMISPELACECPQHVGQLLIELTDFENYSAECENTKPADAAVHNMLRRTAATSRALFENALVQLAEAEGIDLESAQPELGVR